MFPITLTIHNREQLDAVLSVMTPAETSSGSHITNTGQVVKETTAKKPSSATPARTEPTASGAADDAQGKTGGASAQAAGSVAAEPQVSTAATDFETLKKAFLALSTKPDGRTKCEAVLKPFNAAKLSALKPEQYDDAMAKINELGA